MLLSFQSRLKKLPFARPLVARARRLGKRIGLLEPDIPLVCVNPAPEAAEPFVYRPGKHGKGELKIINGVPVLSVEGSPEEIGEQIGVLALKQPMNVDLVSHFLEGLRKDYPVLLKVGKRLLPHFPPAHRREMEAAADTAVWDRDLLVVANTVGDIKKRGACSALVVGAERSATGGPLFGRNLDYLPHGNGYQCSLLFVYRPIGKHAFASVTFPGLFGCMTGMNDAGLTLAGNEVYEAGDGSPKFDPRGVPMPLCLRRVLEECTSVAEAAELFRSVKRTTRISLAICDRQEAAVFEITAKSFAIRPAVEGVAACTNHFRAPGLATALDFPHYHILEKTRELHSVGLEEMQAKLHAVNQGARTIQTAIFEPASLRAHVSLGKGPSTGLPLKMVPLASFLRANEPQMNTDKRRSVKKRERRGRDIRSCNGVAGVFSLFSDLRSSAFICGSFDRGRRVAAALAGSWRRSPPPLDMPAEEVAEIVPSLVQTGAAALVWWRARAHPSPEIARLGQVRWQYTLEALQHEKHLRQLAALLHDLEPIFVKGPALARLYPEPGLRPYVDIDVCVPPERLPDAMRLLQEHGKRFGEVDLHAGVADLEDRTWEQVFKRSRLLSSGDVQVRVLGAEDQLRHLCLHLMRHGAWRPLWLCDMAAALEALPSDFDWDCCLSGDPIRSDWVACAIGLACRLLGASLNESSTATQNVPPWLVAATLREWGSRHPGDSHNRDARPLMSYWRHPAGIARALRRRWPNGIEAKFKAHVSPLAALPRQWFQAAAWLRRGACLPGKLRQGCSSDGLSFTIHAPD